MENVFVLLCCVLICLRNFLFSTFPYNTQFFIIPNSHVIVARMEIDWIYIKTTSNARKKGRKFIFHIYFSLSLNSLSIYFWSIMCRVWVYFSLHTHTSFDIYFSSLLLTSSPDIYHFTREIIRMCVRIFKELELEEEKLTIDSRFWNSKFKNLLTVMKCFFLKFLIKSVTSPWM